MEFEIRLEHWLEDVGRGDGDEEDANVWVWNVGVLH